MTSRGRGAASVATCVATAITMHGLRTTLATPPIHSWSRAETWYEQLGPSMAAMAGLRVLALVVAAWLALAIALQVLASLRCGWALRRVADTVSPGWVRRMGHGMAGLTLSAALVVPVVAPPAPVALSVTANDDPAPLEPADDDGIAVMRPEPEGATTPSTTTTMTGPTMPTTEAPVATTEPRPSSAPGVPGVPATDAARPRLESREVRPGDSCWALAADHLEDSLGAPQSEHAIRELWIRLIELNRDRFVTGDPDVIYPGQVLRLPDVER